MRARIYVRVMRESAGRIIYATLLPCHHGDSKEEAVFVALDGFGQAIANAIAAQPKTKPIGDAVRDGLLAAAGSGAGSDAERRSTLRGEPDDTR